MRTLIIAIILCTVAANATAATYWIVSSSGQIVATTEKKPPVSGLEARGEKAVPGPEPEGVISNYVYKNGSIAKRAKTSEEKRLDEYTEGAKTEEAAIQKKMRQLAIEALKAEGQTFKYVTE